MSLLSNVKSSKATRPRRTLLYGVDGIGKSMLASQWPSPIYLPAEDGLADLDVQTFPVANSIDEFCRNVSALTEEKHDFKTAVVDTLDWVEILIQKDVASRSDANTVADIGYGKGYAEAAANFKLILEMFDRLRDAGMHIFLLAHADIVRFSDPEGDAYDRYEPRLHKTTSALVREWADEVLFANYKVFKKPEDQGFGKKRAIAIGDGARALYTSDRPAWRAKNRLGMPPEIEMTWAAYSQYLPQ